MSKAPNVPPDDIFQIDLRPLRPFLIDLPPGATVGMRHEHDGFRAMAFEVMANQGTYGERAGITGSDYERFVAMNDQFAKVTVAFPVVEKAVEVLNESLAYTDNLRHQLLGHFADSAELHANLSYGDPSLLTAYQRTIAYRSSFGNKGAKTRKKNEESASANEAPLPEPMLDKTASAVATQTEAAPQGATGSKEKKRVHERTTSAPPEAIFQIDLTPLRGILVDLPPHAMRGMLRLHEGFEAAAREIDTNQPVYGDKAGITAKDQERFRTLCSGYEAIAKVLPVVEKAFEILKETRASLDDQRHQLAHLFATSAERHATGEGGDSTLLTAYEKTIAYRASLGEKAAKTRHKNEEAKKNAENGK